uniref:Putative basic tail protein n=1 Tax=Ixodes ricinus TaxID=34613 RepID=A0A0K8RE75_IXORI
MPTFIQMLVHQKQALITVLGRHPTSSFAKQTAQRRMECGWGALVTASVYMLPTAQKADAWSWKVVTMGTTQHQKQKSELYRFRR